MKTHFFLIGLLVIVKTVICQTTCDNKTTLKATILKEISTIHSGFQAKCDTIYFENYLSVFNQNKIRNAEKLILPFPESDTLIINYKTRILNKIEIFNGLDYCYYSNAGTSPNDDYEHFILNDSMIYIDVFYYKMLPTGYAFRSLDIPKVYKFQTENLIYYAVFLKNITSGIAVGNTLFLFSDNIKTKEKKLVFCSINQVANDLSCFGYDKDNSTILYYDWDNDSILEGKKNLTVYKLINGERSYKESIELNITILDPWEMIHCY